MLSEYELQAIGHDGYNADDSSKGGGHYRVVEEVGSFLEGYRKAEVRRIARETSTMMLDVLVKEGVKGLDRLLTGMAREGDNIDDRGGMMRSSSEGGELNLALVRYLEEAIRSQERRVKRAPVARRVDDYHGDDVGEDEADLMWNVTRGEDGTMIETIDPNTPIVRRMLREELEKKHQERRRRRGRRGLGRPPDNDDRAGEDTTATEAFEGSCEGRGGRRERRAREESEGIGLRAEGRE